MKIALARVSSYQKWYRFPSLGLGYLAAVLEANGIETKIFDGRYFNIDDEQLVEEICNFCPDVLGLSAMTHEIKLTASIARIVKEKLNIPVIIGGCHITALPVETMREFPMFDYGVISEGEYTLIDLVKCIKGDIAVEEVEGIVYRKRGELYTNKLREPISELDSLPFPAFHHYYREGRKSLSGKELPYFMFTSRGCPFSCVFCMRILGQNVRSRTIDNIISEIDMAILKYGATVFNFADEIFLFNNERTVKLLKKFIEKGYRDKIKWSALTRANFVNDEIIGLAKKAGCFRLEIGIESGDDKILKRIKKGTTVSQAESAIKIIKKFGIEIFSYYILGHPGETEDTIRETINLAVRLNTTAVAIGIMVPYPGTMIYEWAKDNKFGYKLLSRDWDTYDKYGGSALEIEGLPLNKLISFQRKAYLTFYFKNFRFFDLLKFIISRYKGILKVLLVKK